MEAHRFSGRLSIMNGNVFGLQLGRIFWRAAESAGTAAALGALAFMVLAGTVQAQDAGYIRVIGSKGSLQGASTNPMYKDWIVVRSVVSAPSAADRESSAPSVSEVTTTKPLTTTQSATSGAGAGKTAAGKPGMPSGQYEKGKTMASDDWSQRSAAGGVQSPRDSATGMASGKRMHKPFVIMKEVDKASPKLYEACAHGEHFPEVVIMLNEPGGRWVHYKLTDAIITSINKSGGGDNPTESVTFTYQQIEWTYSKQ
jgi:type VI secretion system Hcp family effector